MRVAYLCADPGIPVFGTKGASVHVQEIVRAFLARGDGVTVYCVRRGSDVPDDLSEVPVVEMRVRADTPAGREERIAQVSRDLADRAAADGCDLVYERFSLFSRAGGAVARATGARSILEVNAPLVEEQREHRVLVDEAGAVAAARDALRGADVVACVSEPVARWARGNGAANVVVAPNGVDTDRICPAAPAFGGPLRVGFVGTLKPWHGVETLIDAMGLVEERHGGGARLVIVGDGPEAASLRRRALDRSVEVEFTGAVAPSTIPSRLSGLDVGVAPYPAAGDDYFSPLKVFEYLAAGLPVVASRVGQIPGIVEHGVTGLLVAPGSPEALAEALASLRDAPVALRAMAAAAREAAVARHDWSRVLAGILAAAPRLEETR
ncbi:glycosyltransferase family 4 protein [Microbacterium sp. 18062]|uniref:glycosyltransferase family 4 protein n=1 Tax=Microbacterium sp. 18062 TaxID=2681410 RepID=UPI001357DDF0|nr:glycosyltransferase family 4 protein [Microbacterium sp. 18062]